MEESICATWCILETKVFYIKSIIINITHIGHIQPTVQNNNEYFVCLLIIL